jgi:nitroreductase
VSDSRLVVVRDRERLRKLGRREDRSVRLSDASRAIQSMMLTAWAGGVGFNQVGFTGMTDVTALEEIPSEYDLVAIVPLGYPKRAASLGRKNRKVLGEIGFVRRRRRCICLRAHR